MPAFPYPVIVGTTGVRAIEGNPRRTALAVSNLAAVAIVYWGRSSELTALNGFPIYPKTVEVFNKALGDRPDLEMWLISDTIATDVRIAEDVEGGA